MEITAIPGSLLVEDALDLIRPLAPVRSESTRCETPQRQGCSFHPGAERNGAEDLDFEGFIGRSPAMRTVYRTIERAARSRAAVFVSGETGTGKELCAQAIHRRGPRRTKSFIAINCGAIPKELMESEIFGHTKGAYTGAAHTRAGAAKLADGGTLFLDEICEMEPSLQVRLLRFLQSGTFRPLGSDRSESVDVRLICATNRDPLEEIATGRMREDLYYRIHVVPVHLLPLRERCGDILPIARHFLSTAAREEGVGFASFAPEAEALLEAHDWPGNVRQLQNAVRSVSVLHDGRTVTPDMLRPLLIRATPARQRTEGNGRAQTHHENGAVRPLRLMEMELIEKAISCCNGNVVAAAKLLEVSPSTIYRKRNGWNRDYAAGP